MTVSPPLSLPRPLLFAIVASVVLPLSLGLGIKFSLPDPRSWFSDRTLDVVLVNARHRTAPKKAEALAQANLDGGGNTSAPNKRASTQAPSPKAGDTDQEVLPRTAPAAARPAAAAREVLTTSQPNAKQHTRGTGAAEVAPKMALNPAELLAQAREITRLESEIAAKTNQLQTHSRRADFGGRTREYRFARYVEDWRLKIERVGNLNYPEEARRNGIYGRLILSVEIGADGSLKAVRTDRSSGFTELDEAAKRIVRLAAPYAPFPEDLRRDFDSLRIVRTWTFTRDNQLAAE